MFLGMVKETSKDKKWSKGSKESTEGQGKAIRVWFTWSGKISYNIGDKGSPQFSNTFHVWTLLWCNHLEWFLKYLLPYISKDVSTSGVTTKEEAILRSQQMDLMYAQSGILYEIIPEAPRSTHSIENPSLDPMLMAWLVQWILPL